MMKEEKKQSLRDFVVEWNSAHKHEFIFTVIYAPVEERPVSILVRYNPKKYRQQARFAHWRVASYVEGLFFNKDQIMAVKDESYELGKITIDVHPCLVSYSEQKIIEVLKSIGEEFFTKSY